MSTPSHRSGKTPPEERTVWRSYFTAFLPALLNRLLIEDLHSLNCRFAYRVLGSDEVPWNLAVAQGCLVEVRQGGAEPDCLFVCDEPTLLDIVRGELPPQEAFFAMRVEIEGDLELGMRLSSVLAPFFQRFPFRPCV